jgi:RNA polymerase-binding transcription factor DksA
MKMLQFKIRLLAEKEKLESEMKGIGHRNPGVPDDWEAAPTELGTESDLADQADVVMNHENNSSILADLEARYDTILAALDRIEKRTYGKCEVCGELISEARLEAEPAAVTCTLHM